MAYFNNPRNEEDLKEQFRKLLIKNDYRNPKNERLIKEIRKEYDEKLLQIKRANGYQTFGDKANNFMKNTSRAIQNYSDKVEQERIQEKQRIQQLKNKKYTKQEYTDLINKEKYYIRQIIENAVKQENTVYLSLKAYTKTNNFVEVYRFFTSNSILLQSVIKPTEFNALREQIEYATEYFSQSTKQYDNLMNELDIMMGKHINQCIIKFEDMYLDPLHIQETDSRYGHSTKVQGNWNSQLHKLFTLPAYIMLVITALVGITTEPSAFVFSLLCIVWLIIIEFWYKFVVLPHEKRKNRVRTHSQAVQEEKLSKGLAHFLSSLFR